jgi:tRNA(adenine34) deaminase
MRAALAEGRRALRRDEVPIGAVVVVGDELVGRGYNRPISSVDPTAHAEIVALRRAARRRANYRLGGAEMFVTVEPCLMCLGALLQARVARVVFGAADPKVGTLSGRGGPGRWRGVNHRFHVRGGVLASESAALLQSFFATRRRGGVASIG